MSFEDAFFAAADDWFDRYGRLPVQLAGMIGSNIGWAECSYVSCPCDATAFAASVRRFSARGIEIGIAPGLSCRNAFGLPDVMRGEEAQIFGLIDHLGHHDGALLVCLPGTHGKWALVEDKAILGFVTSMQGEMFEVLLTHTLLGRGLPQAPDRAPIHAGTPEFLRGVETILTDPALAMELAVFATRSRFVTGDLAADDAPAFLSGLLISCEVRDVVRAYRDRGITVEEVVLVGADALMPLYEAVLVALGIGTRSVPAHIANVKGLSALVAGTA